MTDEQLLAYLTQQGDLSLEERKLAQQQALAGQLRTQALQPSSGKDVGSQLARAITGGMAGYQMGQSNKAMDAYGAARDKSMGGLRDLLLNKQQGPVQLSGPAPDEY